MTARGSVPGSVPFSMFTGGGEGMRSLEPLHPMNRGGYGLD